MNAIEKRFRQFFAEDENGCWIWQGGLSSGGYGKFWLNGKTIPVTKSGRPAYAGEGGTVSQSHRGGYA
jgi:hypothetical protein